MVGDLGAHRGIIVSKAGFQAGAYEAARNTNIDLFTFTELQQAFFERWRAAIAIHNMPFADRLFPYWDPSGGKRPPSHWGRPEQEKLRLLAEAYHPFIILGPMLQDSGYRLQFPMQVPIVDDAITPVGQIELTTYRQFYDFIEANKDTALRRYEALFAERTK